MWSKPKNAPAERETRGALLSHLVSRFQTSSLLHHPDLQDSTHSLLQTFDFLVAPIISVTATVTHVCRIAFTVVDDVHPICIITRQTIHVSLLSTHCCGDSILLASLGKNVADMRRYNRCYDDDFDNNNSNCYYSPWDNWARWVVLVVVIVVFLIVLFLFSYAETPCTLLFFSS